MNCTHSGNAYRATVMALACVLLVFNTAAAASRGDRADQYGGKYRMPLASEPTTLDPAKFNGIYAMTVANNLFDGLVAFDSNLNPVPALAKVWKISRDHKVYTFRLRQGVKFHNGREVTAQDFVFSLTRLLDPQIDSPAASLFFKIRGGEAFHKGKAKHVAGLKTKGPYTLIIELESPFAPFLSILAMANAKVVPQEAVGPDFDHRPVGTGPFKLKTWQSGEVIRLAANTDYFGGRPYLDELVFRIYKNVNWPEVFTDFENGGLEQSLIPGGDTLTVKRSQDNPEKTNVISKPGLNVVYVGLNMKLEAFQDRRVRQAIYYAVDRNKIVAQSTRWRSVEAKGILPPGIAGFDPHFKGYPYDPEKARRLLAVAGYPQGRGIPTIEFWTVAKTDRVRAQMEAYKQYLSAIGIRVQLKVADNWKEFVARINQKKADMFYAAWYADFPDPDNFLYTLFHSKSKTNRMGYHNPEVDRMLEEARAEVDYLKRVQQYREIQLRVMADAPLISQHYNSFNYVFQPWVKGIELNHLGGVYLPFKKIWIDAHVYSQHQQVSGRIAQR